MTSRASFASTCCALATPRVCSWARGRGSSHRLRETQLSVSEILRLPNASTQPQPPSLFGPGIKAGFEKDASPEQDRGIRVTEAVVETMRDEKDMISGKKKRYE